MYVSQVQQTLLGLQDPEMITDNTLPHQKELNKTF